jgi:predicted DNA repair protein MutK
MTIGVYGLVAAIVKLDDVGFYLLRASTARPGGALLRSLGGLVLRASPWLMRALGVGGTIAMFLVGGSILLHGVPPLAHALEGIPGSLGASSALIISLATPVIEGIVGLVVGTVLVVLTNLLQRMKTR